MAERGMADERLILLHDAALALDAAIQRVGINTTDESVEMHFKGSVERLSGRSRAEGEDPLAYQAAAALAAVSVLLEVASEAYQGRGAGATKTCFRKLPSAPMHLVEGAASEFWLCEHIPSHRKP